MDAEEIVIASAEAAATTVGTERFATLTKHALVLLGAEMARRVRADDKPGLFAPADLVRDGKDRLAAILALEDRVVVGWTAGALRTQNFDAVIPKADISTTALGERPGSAFKKPRETLRISAGEAWDFVFANVFEGGTSIVPILEAVIGGALKPVFSDG